MVNVVAPQLEVVGETHSAPMAPQDAPSMQAMKRMGAQLQGVQLQQHGHGRRGGPAAARRRTRTSYYDEIIRKLQQDPKHVQHIQDFWGDTLDRGGRAERRRQGLLCAGQPRRQPGHRRWPTKSVEAVRKVVEDDPGAARGARPTSPARRR